MGLRGKVLISTADKSSYFQDFASSLLQDGKNLPLMLTASGKNFALKNFICQNNNELNRKLQRHFFQGISAGVIEDIESTKSSCDDTVSR